MLALLDGRNKRKIANRDVIIVVCFICFITLFYNGDWNVYANCVVKVGYRSGYAVHVFCDDSGSNSREICRLDRCLLRNEYVFVHTAHTGKREKRNIIIPAWSSYNQELYIRNEKKSIAHRIIMFTFHHSEITMQHLFWPYHCWMIDLSVGQHRTRVRSYAGFCCCCCIVSVQSLWIANFKFIHL
jgi:hypothetical protein